MTESAPDVVNFRLQGLRGFVELAALLAELVLPLKSLRRIDEGRAERLGSYLLHSAVFLSLRCEQSAARCQSEKL